MPPSGRNISLSKSLYMRGLQCHKSLYLHKHRPELRSEPAPELLALWKSGTEVGVYARQLFPGGVEIPFEGLPKEEQLSRTRQEIGQGTKVLYEATFAHDNVFVKADILCRSPEGFDLYEVKSATDVKEHNWYDIAIQHYVLAGSGIPVHRDYLVHINSAYVRQGEIVPRELFVIQDVTDVVRKRQDAIPEELAALRRMLGGKEPDIDIGPHCSDPHECDFIAHCWRHIPEHSIFTLRGRGIDKWDLYRRGIIELSDVPLSFLNAAQQMQVKYFLRKDDHARPEKIREFLEGLWHPICFLDFETFRSAIPLFDGTRPYQQVPFLYSLHRRDAEGALLQHSEFLARPGADPRISLVEKLLGEIPDGACVLVYNMAFEKGVLRNLAEYLPTHRKRLYAVIDGLVDLMEPFRRREIYHWMMSGSYSLKSVLPVLVPDMTYEGLAIRDGEMASEAYFTMGDIENVEEQQKLRKALLEYCRQDTLGMVRLLEKMGSMSK
jgi:hypothetical protein